MKHMAILCIVLMHAGLLAARESQYTGKRLIARFAGNEENNENEAFGAKELYDEAYDYEADDEAYDYDDGLYYADAYDEEEDADVYGEEDGLYYDEDAAYDYDEEEGDYDAAAYEEEGDYYDDEEEGDYAYDEEEGDYYDEDYYDEDYGDYGDYGDYDADLYDDEYYDEDYDDEDYGDYGGYYDDMGYDLAALQQMYNYNAYQQMYANLMREYANLYDEANQYTQNYMKQMQQQANSGSKKKYDPSQSVANAYNAYQNQYGYY